MSPRVNLNPSSKPTPGSAKRKARTLRRQKSVLQLQPNPITYRIDDAIPENTTQEHVTPTPEIPIERATRCKDFWFEDGDVYVWAYNRNSSMLYRVHRRVLRESGAEPFCTVVNCEYPNPETSDEPFLDGLWVLRYAEQDPFDVMHLLKWMYERPSISKRSTIPFVALRIYLERSEIHFAPEMRRCALEYLWNMFPTDLNYHQRVPTLVEDCYSADPPHIYKPYVLLTLAVLSTKYQLVAILPLLYYYIAQWPIDWIIHGVPASCVGYDHGYPDSFLFELPPEHAQAVLVGREKLIQMRRIQVFNFMEDFTLNGVTLDFPTPGCDGEKWQETGETCFEWLMRIWFFMYRLGSIARPSALDVMNMGQWMELRRNCCQACGERVIKHMLEGRDDVWEKIPGAFGYKTWDFVVGEQKNVEKHIAAAIF